jgi:hypothetical protein
MPGTWLEFAAKQLCSPITMQQCVLQYTIPGSFGLGIHEHGAGL